MKSSEMSTTTISDFLPWSLSHLHIRCLTLTRRLANCNKYLFQHCAIKSRFMFVPLRVYVRYLRILLWVWEVMAVSPAPIKFNSLKQNDFECFSFESGALLGTVQISQQQSNKLFHDFVMRERIVWVLVIKFGCREAILCYCAPVGRWGTSCSLHYHTGAPRRCLVYA